MTAERPWRCFVAVPIGDGLRQALAAHVAGWRREPTLAGLRWSDPSAWHVTLAFLGAVMPARVPEVETAIRRVAADHRAAELTTGGLGAFPRPRQARVAWYGIDDPHAALAALAGDLAARLGLDPGGAYRPHLTLARARSAPVDLRSWLAAASPAAPRGRVEVRRMELVRSHLGGGPARYETLASVSLA